MLKIGEFAKKCGVNVQTLRYYDQIGVLCPDRVDDATGYRYYHPDKIKTFFMLCVPFCLWMDMIRSCVCMADICHVYYIPFLSSKQELF